MLCWWYHSLFYLRHCPSPDHLSSGSWQSICKKLTGMQAWMSRIDLPVICLWRDQDVVEVILISEPKLLVCLFVRQLVPLAGHECYDSKCWGDQAWMLQERALLLPSLPMPAFFCLWFILAKFSAQHQVLQLCEGIMPWAQQSKDRLGSQAVCPRT